VKINSIKSSEVRIGKNCKRVSLQRYLVSKVIYEIKEVEFRDLAGLFANQLWLESKANEDPNFKEIYSSELDLLSSILKEVRIDKGLTIRAALKLRTRLTKLERFPVPKRNFKTFKQRFENSVQLHTTRPLGINKKLLPPKAYIGKGYSDKGHAKKTEVDGSPSWQDVASSKTKLELALYDLQEAKTIQDIELLFIEHIFSEEERKQYLTEH
jgi:hypothetical protein